MNKIKTRNVAICYTLDCIEEDKDYQHTPSKSHLFLDAIVLSIEIDDRLLKYIDNEDAKECPDEANLRTKYASLLGYLRSIPTDVFANKEV